jgi:hypothetical protein
MPCGGSHLLGPGQIEMVVLVRVHAGPHSVRKQQLICAGLFDDQLEPQGEVNIISFIRQHLLVPPRLK